MKISSNQPNKQQRGFTLVELLMVIAIIAILATLSLAVLRSSQEEARTSATEARITQIQNMLAIYIEDMEFRKLPFSNGQIENCIVGASMSELYLRFHQLRERILADYLISEMPFSQVNVGVFPSLDYSAYPGAADLVPTRPTALVQQWVNLANGNLGVDQIANEPLSGELLYQILAMVQLENGSALESLGNGAVGNIDDDSYPEVVDAWGNPLQFHVVKRDPTTGDSIALTSSDPSIELQNLRFEVWSSTKQMGDQRRVEF